MGTKELAERSVSTAEVSERNSVYFRSNTEKNYLGNKILYFTKSIFMAQTIPKYQKVLLNRLKDIICTKSQS